jgi:hypothetical protein
MYDFYDDHASEQIKYFLRTIVDNKLHPPHCIEDPYLESASRIRSNLKIAISFAYPTAFAKMYVHTYVGQVYVHTYICRSGEFFFKPEVALLCMYASFF